MANKRFYEHGNKSGRLLARMLREKGSSTQVHAIRDTEGGVHSTPKGIAHQFRAYYGKLYNLKQSEQTCTPTHNHEETVKAFLQVHCPKQVKEEDIEMLGRPLSNAELAQAVSQMKPGKSPGPDGFSAQYYKTFLTQLSEPFLSTFNALPETATCPPSLLEAHIVVLPKGDRDPTAVSNYRPISLLNVDLKLCENSSQPSVFPTADMGLLGSGRICPWKESQGQYNQGTEHTPLADLKPDTGLLPVS